MRPRQRPARSRCTGRSDSDSFIPPDAAVQDMVDTTVALAIIAVTLVALALMTYGAIRFVPASLEVEVEGEDADENNDSTAG